MGKWIILAVLAAAYACSGDAVDDEPVDYVTEPLPGDDFFLPRYPDGGLIEDR